MGVMVSPVRSSTAMRFARCRCGRTWKSLRLESERAVARLAAAQSGCSTCSACRRTGSGPPRRSRTEPRFVLLDEPAAGLPEAELPEFEAVVRSLRDEHGAGVLLIDHNMALIMSVCDRIHVLDQGKTLAEGAPDEIRSNLDVAAAYLGERAVQEGAGGEAE